MVSEATQLKVVGDGDLLRCLAKHLIYYPSDYNKPQTKCPGCNQDARCYLVRLALRK